MRFYRRGYYRTIGIGAIAILSLTAAAKLKPIQVLKVEIQATVIDRATLLAKLNKDGKHHHMRFVEVGGKNYDYRIVFATGEKGNPKVPGWGGIWSMTVHYSDTAVFGPTGTELFRFHSDNNYTSGGATNAAAKEIIKQIRRLHTIEEEKEGMTSEVQRGSFLTSRI